MLVARSIDEFNVFRSELTRYGERLSFVPTMGFLHRGHLSLVQLARKRGERSVVSIFVNPTQFNDRRDFDSYPIDLPRDLKMLEAEGVDLVFVPTVSEIYGPEIEGDEREFQSWIDVTSLSVPFEGRSRPGHFRGVATVVAILFNIVRPYVAIFGEKDFQQVRLIEKLVEDLKLQVQIIRGPIVREADGLAMSSRNIRLAPEAREAAQRLSAGLFAAREAVRSGESDAAKLTELVRGELSKSSLIVPDYVSLVDERSLTEIPRVRNPSRILLAAQVGGVRLLDNIALGIEQV